MPNTFAYIILIIWPFISLIFYKQMPPIQATFWTIVGGGLILPVNVEIDFPLVPALDKFTIPAITALIGLVVIKKEKIFLVPKAGIEKWLVWILIITPFFTMLNNQETVRNIPGITLHDTLSEILGMYLYLLPFILGMQIIKTSDDLLLLLKLLVVAGLWYSLPILFEIRMSPQLHTWTYGFFPHMFHQQIRFGGYRPVVFLGHGLLVAMFIAVVVGASAVLLKQKIRVLGAPPVLVVMYLIVVLILCKSLAAAIFGIFLLVAILGLSSKLVKNLSIFIVFLVILYPALSITGYFPHEKIIETAANFNLERAQSLDFRFYHENLLLNHAEEKLFFGWGGWGRSTLERSVTDGFWIIIFGKFGLAGFIAIFGLIGVSIWKAIKASKLLKNKKEANLLLSYALIVAVIMSDQIPNASIQAWTFFYIGSLLGIVNSIVKLNYRNSNQAPNYKALYK